MKNIIIYYFEKKDTSQEEINYHKIIINSLKLQIDISLALNWNPKDIIILINKKFNYRNIRSIYFDQDEIPYSHYIYKIIGLIYLINKMKNNENIWYHDWDLFQIDELNYSFPKNKDIGVYYGTYYQRRNRPQGASIFLKKSAIDILEEALKVQTDKKQNLHEFSLKTVLENKQERVDKINACYNMGFTDFKKRLKEINEDVKCIHNKFIKKRKSKQILSFIEKQSLSNKNTNKILPLFQDFIKNDRIK